MTTLTIPASPPSSAPRGIPPLEAGDRLTLREFLRRYEAMPDVNRAELIEGIVSMPSPVPVAHASAHGSFNGVLWIYVTHTPGVEAGDNGTILLDDLNGPQPDAYLRILPEFGGQSRTENGYVVSSPEFLAEIAASSVSRDLHDKFAAYQRNGVREYVVWRVFDRQLDWFTLRDGRFERTAPDPNGIHRSEAFSGLWIHAPALLGGDFPTVLAALHAGLATPEHAEFRARLEAARRAGA